MSEVNSQKIKGAVLRDRHVHLNTWGDVWETTWADDGKLYSVSDDSNGIAEVPVISMGDEAFSPSNFVYVRFDSVDSDRIEGITVNKMLEYGKVAELVPVGNTDGCCWKACGNTCVDGVLYAVISRHGYGLTSSDPSFRQTAHGASIIKSTDYGKTWTRSAAENYLNPMFRGGRFANPFFIDYGQNYSLSAHGSDRYVYAISNNHFWDNGDSMLLARVSREAIGTLNPIDWQYYAGGDGMEDSSWSQEIAKAVPIHENQGRCSMTGAQYIEALDRYVMIQWYYTSGSGQNNKVAKEKGLANAGQETVWEFYEAPTPWGSWKLFHTEKHSTDGCYNPCIVSKSISEEGKRFTIYTNGNFHTHKAKADECIYRLMSFTCELEV